MKVVSQDIVEAMRAGLAGQTTAALMPCYGISYNTWRKVQSGSAIRRSVAERLEQRLLGANAPSRERPTHF
ncbi:hypothetical protein ASG67_16850 [Sphingomonas sp. Leaf339]|nr:hypothetical protein ASG67_16850 [Sphingomonas sp. Leaf339]